MSRGLDEQLFAPLKYHVTLLLSHQSFFRHFLQLQSTLAGYQELGFSEMVKYFVVFSC